MAPPNPPTFADAGPDQAVELGTTVVLDASRSYDGFNLGFDPMSGHTFEKDTLTFAWEWVSGPQRVDPVQDEPTNPQATVTLNLVGDYVYRVTADDNVNSLPGMDSVTITVVEDIPGNQTPVAIVDAPTAAVVGDTIILDGSGSTDPDGDSLWYYWRQTDELGGDLPADDLSRTFLPISGREEAICTWQVVRAGTFYVRLLVGDGLLTDVSDVYSIDVVEPATAGVTVAGEAEPVEGSGELGDSVEMPAPSALCGAGLFPLALVPLLMWPMRGRIR
jgi:hypothetical protein